MQTMIQKFKCARYKNKAVVNQTIPDKLKETLVAEYV